MPRKRTISNDPASPINETVPEKRARSKPSRYSNPTHATSNLKERSIIKTLITALKKWDDVNLTSLSYTLQWDLNVSIEELAASIGKDPQEVKSLLQLIKRTKWEDQSLKISMGGNYYFPKDEHASSENMVDLWRTLCARLTPDFLDNSSEIAAVFRDIADSCDDDFSAIYKYIAMSLDDPVSTQKSMPDLSPMQCGMILDIMHSLMTDVKQHDNLKDYLQERALAAVLGEWDSLKMPDPSKETDKKVLAKRISLQSLNPFNMSRTSLPPVVVKMPPNTSIDPPSEPPRLAVPVRSNFRPMNEMVKVKTGFKTLEVPNDATETRNSTTKDSCKECDPTSTSATTVPPTDIDEEIEEEYGDESDGMD